MGRRKGDTVLMSEPFLFSFLNMAKTLQASQPTKRKDPPSASAPQLRITVMAHLPGLLQE